MRIHYSSRLARALRWLLPETRAFTFGRHVFIAEDRAAHELLLHEACHFIQFRRYGTLGFVLRYAWHTLTVGYLSNPLEIEARRFARQKVDRWSFLEIQEFLHSLRHSG